MIGGPVIIMAGGTGGHVFPALAVAAELRGRAADVVWMGTRTGLEARVVPEAGIPIEWVQVAGLRGKRLTSWLIAPFRLLHAFGQALRIIRRLRPAVVLGMGGFVSGPGGLAAWILRRPLVIHEQNAVAGLTNRILARFARDVLEAFPNSFAAVRNARRIGNPVRADIAALDAPAQRLADRKGPVRLLILGGSQGALALNRAVPGALANIPRELRPDVWHQCGVRTENEAREAYRRAGLDARIDAFIDDMGAAYAWSDLVICRAGALTIAELAAAGVAAVLVPFPYAVDDHQAANASFLVEAGAAILLPEDQLDADDLAAQLRVLTGDRKKLLEMATAARAVAAPDATHALAQACLAAARGARS